IAAVAAYNAELAKVTPENDNAAAIATAKTAMDNAKAARDTAYEAMNMQWTWGGTAADAFKFTSAQDGTFEVTGLAYTLNGVRYFLEETKPPAGYADMQSDVEFTVDDNSYWADPTAVEPVAADPLEVLNNKVTIPQTGGIGTVIFIVAGLLIMGTAVVVMKKRQELDV
ncbi:MAG: SpaA isopeptide-forming pilin-related protein, partial [Gallicola sp.]|nr:SpaA isopeptide-forming pilin-related protein [Gallicola sp.]